MNEKDTNQAMGCCQSDQLELFRRDEKAIKIKIFNKIEQLKFHLCVLGKYRTLL